MKNLFLILLFFFITGQALGQLKIKADIKKIDIGDSVILSWKVENIKKVKNITIRDLAENLDNQGEICIKPEKSKRYRLEVFTNKKNKKYTKGVWIEVLQPEIISFNTVSQYNNDRDSTEFYWKTQNTEYVLIDGYTKKLPTEGKIKLLLDTTSTIKLTAFNKNGIPVEKEIKVSIKNIEYLKGEHYPFLYDTVLISWQYKYCNYVKIRGFDKKFKPKDRLTFVALKDTAYYLSIYKENGDTLKKTFKVNVRSPLISFRVPEVVFKGMPVSMFWEVKEGFSVKLTGTGKTITAQKGIIRIPQDTEKKYTITVKDYKGKIVAKETKSIQKIKSPIKLFEVPEDAFTNVPVYIKWEVEPMFTVAIEGLSKKLSPKGKAKVIPYADRKYTMIVYYRGNEIERQEKIMSVSRRRKYIKGIVDYKNLNKNAKLNFEIFAIDESNHPNEVKLYVLAVDDKGNFVQGLEKINNSGKKKIIKMLIEKAGRNSKKITNYKLKEFNNNVSLPYDISLSLDYSGSMGWTITNLEKSAHTFINNKDKTDRISIARFDHQLAKVCDLEQNKDSLLKFFTMKGLDTLGGATALYAGGDYAMNMIAGTKNNKVLILFTDGMENSSLYYVGQYAYTATQLAKKAKQLGVTIFVIAYGVGVNNRVLQQLAYTTGGNFYQLKNTDDINQIFKELPIIFKNYYVISYKPSSRKGKHSIRIVYDNLQGKKQSTVANYMVGDKFIIDEYDKTYEKNYWQKAADSLQKKPVSVPQAVAYFDFDKTKLLDKYKKMIDTFIEYLNTQENNSIIIFGHTDSKGSDKYCYDLSLRRAQKVKNYMIENGIDENRIFIKGCGKDEMIWKPEDQEWKAHENRRTEILLLN